MRRIVKTANKFDTAWTAFVMFPAVIMLMNAAISLHQGKSTPAELGQAAQVVATKFSSQYTPYIKTTGGAITTGATKLMNVVRSCAGGNSGPVFIDPAMAGKNGCALPGKINTSAAYGTPYRSYR